ncbi:DUF2852 domain-containing protein [Tabrizicola piscis]|uniref:DUF2852 domain-containing protein n=1 Tax=Tabrizicola piscis TaxID=2494374 RepID=A0A3S8U1T5_9RHOB|nr:DUF2852 domain-containing protein [Tabrizicola piscis]AZL57546.1 DUF2852 domain-containing protein [Tabrizicola piscis]
MHTYSETARTGGFRTTLRRAEAWLDQYGRKGWIAAMVLAFVLFWPIGLALLAYMIWGKQMFARSCGQSRHRNDQSWTRHADRVGSATGNHAFDSYKAEALRRLEEEQAAFEAFLQRLRTSKDKSEFDAFMEDRARSTASRETGEDGAEDTSPSAKGDTAAKPAGEARPGEY